MKNNIILILVMLSPLFAFSQDFSNAEKAIISGKIDTLIQKYLNKSALSEMPGLKKRNEKMFKEFKNLFANDASIYDDMNAIFDPQVAKDYQSGKSKEYPYKLETKSRLDYFDGLVDDFENGFVINNRKLNISYNNFDAGIVKVALERQIEGTSFKGFKLQNNDTLLLTIAVLKDKSVKISKIEPIGSHIKVLNDNDLDGVINEKDDCPDAFGKISLNGCPDKDDDGIPDKNDECPDIAGPSSNSGCPPSTFSYQFVFSASVGSPYSATTIEMPSYSQMGGYTQINGRKSTPGEIDKQKFKLGFGINANIAYYMGKNKQSRNKGISIGFSTISYKSDYVINNAKFVFMSTDSHNQQYSRIVTLNAATESVSFNIINVPLLFKFKGRFKEKWAYEYSLGASYMIFNTSSTYTYNISLEGRFNSSFKYNANDNFDNISDLVVTGEGVNSHLGSPNASYNTDNVGTLFSSLNESSNEYDFVYNRDVMNNSNADVKSTRNGIGLDIGADLFYHIRPKIAIKAGLSGIYVPSALMLINKSDDSSYKIINSSDGSDYHTIFDSSAKSKFSSIGLNIGIIIGISTSKVKANK